MAFEWRELYPGVRPATREAIVELRALIEPYGNVYYVDGSVNSSGDGSTWEKAFKTIQEGLNKARYTAGTTNINTDKDRQVYVYVAPGQYNEQVLWSAYNVHLIGVQDIGNIDYGVVVNYDGSSGSPAAMAFSGAGCSIQNIQINMATAYPALYLSVFDGCLLKNVTLKGDGTNATIGIWGANVKESVIDSCHVHDFQTAGIHVGQGDGGDTYFCTSEIKNCKVSGDGTTGIMVHANAVATAALGSFIHQNKIVGTCTTGIHQDAAGAYVLISDNWIQAGTAVTDDGTGAADNHTAS